MGSFYQALVMKLLGANIYVWKFSSLVIIVPLGIFFFYICKKYFDLKTAFLRLLMCDSSFYYYNFFQIGYLNNLSLLCMVILIYFLLKVDFTEKKEVFIPFIIIGLLSGFSWYFYIGKLFFFVVAMYLGIKIYYKKNFYKPYLLFLSIALIFIGISFINTPNSHSQFGLTKTILHREYTDNKQVLYNLLYPWYLQFHTSWGTHYLPISAYTDIITAVLSILGILLIVYNFIFRKKESKYMNILALFVLFASSIAITSPYSYPPTTRGIHYLPFYFLFACYALFALSKFINKYIVINIYIFCAISILLLNLTAILKPLPLNASQLVFKELMKDSPSKILLINNCGNIYNPDNILVMNDGYMLHNKLNEKNSMSATECNSYNIVVICQAIPCKQAIIGKSIETVTFYRLNNNNTSTTKKIVFPIKKLPNRQNLEKH